MIAVQRDYVLFVYACGAIHTCGPGFHGFSMASVFDNPGFKAVSTA